MDAPLYNRVKQLTGNGCYPLHMPGHKRNKDFVDDDLLSLDITEIDGSDNMYNPTDVILEAENEIAKLNGCDKSLFLINGGSGGVLTSIIGTMNEGDKIIVCRNAHKSVHNALILSGAMPVYINNNILNDGIVDAVSAKALKSAFEKHPDAKAVIITSPTYEGITSDISLLADITHKNNAILIVDETHGAHFAFNNNFPTNAIKQGADISINSWHKTLPCPNQSAVININKQNVDLKRIFDAYSMVQSTSPSYIMMALMDKMRAVLTEDKSIFDSYINELKLVRARLSKLKGMKLFCGNGQYDISKLVILTGKNLSGKALAQMLLKEYNIQVELAELGYIIAMTSVADNYSALNKFADALLEIDTRLEPYQDLPKADVKHIVSMPSISPRAAYYSDKALVKPDDAVGHICGECITPFPPDIPLIITGEHITQEHIKRLGEYLASGTEVIGLEDNKIKIIEENTNEF